MKRIVFSLIICLFMFPSLVDAAECSASDRERLQKFANNVTFTLEEANYNGKFYFDVLFAGVSSDLLFRSSEKLSYYKNYSSNYIDEFVVEMLEPGRTYEFEVLGYTKCNTTLLRNITITVPNYNVYHNDNVCNDAKEYSLCNKWYKNEYSYDEFVKKVTEFKNNKQNNKNDYEQNISNDNGGFDLYSFYQKYYWYVLFSMIAALGLLIYFWIKENKKNKL